LSTQPLCLSIDITHSFRHEREKHAPIGGRKKAIGTWPCMIHASMHTHKQRLQSFTHELSKTFFRAHTHAPSFPPSFLSRTLLFTLNKQALHPCSPPQAPVHHCQAAVHSLTMILGGSLRVFLLRGEGMNERNSRTLMTDRQTGRPSLSKKASTVPQPVRAWGKRIPPFLSFTELSPFLSLWVLPL